jgi:hypothetical protein
MVSYFRNEHELQVVAFWILTASSYVVGYQRFGGLCCLHLQGEVTEEWIEVQIVVFWVMTPCSYVVIYKFRMTMQLLSSG